MKKFVNKETIVTNVNSLIGKKAIVLEEINSITGTGQIKVDGEVWSAKTLGDEIIAKGSEVEISSLDGVKACVKLIEKNQNSIIENKLD